MEREYVRLHKDAQKCMYVGNLIFTLILIVIGVIFIFFIPAFGNAVKIAIGIVLGAAILFLLVNPSIRYMRYRYKLTEEELQVIKGIWWISHTVVPIERIQKMTITNGPIDRLFSLSKVEVVTAGGEETIDFLKQEEAEKITNGLKGKINQLVREEKEDA